MTWKHALVKGCVILCMLMASVYAFAQEETKTMTDADLSETQEESAIGEEAYLPPSETKSEVIPGASATSVADLLNKPIFQQNVTLDFKDADLQNVVRLIAKKTGINIIMSKEVVKGTVTVHLEDVPLGVALDVILKTNDLGYVLEPGNIVRIVPRKMIQIRPVEVETQFFSINWIPVSELAETLEPFLSSHGEIHEHSDTNSLIITDTPPNIRIFENLIERLDKPQSQVEIETRLANIDVGAFHDFGIDWTLNTQGQEYNLIAPEKFGTYDWWSRKALASANGNGTTDGDLSTALLADILGGSSAATYATEGLDNIVDISKEGNELNIRLGKVASIFGEDIGIDAWLHALEEQSEAVVLANPRVVTLNNIPATIDIVQDIPYFEAIEKEGGQIRQSVKFKEAGLRLTVTPYITDNGFIRMRLEPEQKIRVGEVSGYDSTVPIISTRKAITNVIVEDEQTVCMAGLRQHETIGSQGGVPWLTKVPVLGWLFKDTSNKMNKSELVIFVTPHIVKKPDMNKKQQYQYDWIDGVWTLPGKFFEDYPTIPRTYKEIEREMYPNAFSVEDMKEREKAK